MLEGADVQALDVALEAPLGAKASAKWVLQVKGETRQATRRAENFVEQLRGAGGWHDVMVQLPSKDGAHLHKPTQELQDSADGYAHEEVEGRVSSMKGVWRQ